MKVKINHLHACDYYPIKMVDVNGHPWTDFEFQNPFLPKRSYN